MVGEHRYERCLFALPRVAMVAIVVMAALKRSLYLVGGLAAGVRHLHL
jgi:hypothetical protein